MDLFSYDNLSRIANSEVASEIIDYVKHAYEEKFSNAPARRFCYKDFKRIYTDGNRADWQNTSVEGVTELIYLRLLALVDEAYIEPLEQAIFEMCNMFTWAWPAHSYDKDGRFDYGFIDLRVAEYAGVLAETVHVFGDKLSVDIRDRVVFSIKSKVVDNYESRDFWWEEEVNNWLAVCAGGIGLAYVYCFPERLPIVKDRLFGTFERFVSQIPDDGAYTEGIGYLDFAFSNFCQFYGAYETLTGERPAIMDSPKLKAVVKFLNNCAFDGGLLIPFSDGWHHGSVRGLGPIMTIKLVYPALDVPENTNMS